MNTQIQKAIAVLAFGATMVAFCVYTASLPTTLKTSSYQSASSSQNLSGNTGGNQTTSPSNSTGSSTSPSSQTAPTGSLTSSQSISDTTANWAGYAASGSNFTQVSGSWTIPTVSSADSDTSADAAWIGIGGLNTEDLIQVGTQNVVSSSGQLETTAFYEMLPEDSVAIPNVTINPGDAVTASIVASGTDEWTINLKDSTNGTSYSTTVYYASSESSAEWIEEDPSDGESQIPLDNFGSITFTGGHAVENGSSQNISGMSAQALTMDNEAQQALTTTSNLSAGGTSFTVSRTSAQTGAGLTQFNNSPGGWQRHGAGLSPWSTGYSQPSPDTGTNGSPYSTGFTESSPNGVTTIWW